MLAVLSVVLHSSNILVAGWLFTTPKITQPPSQNEFIWTPVRRHDQGKSIVLNRPHAAKNKNRVPFQTAHHLDIHNLLTKSH